MKTYGMIRLILLTVTFWGASHSAFATNKVWDITVPSFAVTDVTPLEAFVALERLSQRLDPSGRGIRVVVPPRWDDMKMSLTATALPLGGILKALAGNRDVFLVCDVALVCDRQEMGQPINRHAVLSGTVRDAVSKVAITNATITSVHYPPEDHKSVAKVSKDGSFEAVITYMVTRPHCYDLAVCTEGDDTPEVLITAPGYEDRKIRVFLGDSTRFVPPSVDVTLVSTQNVSNTASHGTSLRAAPHR